MGNLLAYSGIVTKVRAMQAKLLTDEDFQNIAAFHTVTEVAAYLKEHPGYRNVLADMDENRLHRGEIEKLLVQSLYSDYTRLYRFSGMDQKKFLDSTTIRSLLIWIIRKYSSTNIRISPSIN